MDGHDDLFDDTVIDQRRPFSSGLFNIYFLLQLLLPGSFPAWHVFVLALERLTVNYKKVVDQLIENSSLLKPTWRYSSSLPARDSNLLLKLFVQLYFRVRKWAYV